MKILILCTGNSCRSQMAEGFLHSLHPEWKIFSAGTKPEKEVNPLAVKAMAEVGIDISHQQPKSIQQFIGYDFDYVITVCDNARESCPIFTGKVKHRLHIGFEDPANARGNEEERLEVYRRVRNEIMNQFENLKIKKL
jgi:arsenate reductase